MKYMEANTALELIASYSLFTLLMGILIKLQWDNRDEVRKLSERIISKTDKQDERIVELGTQLNDHEQRIYKAEHCINVFDEWRRNIDYKNKGDP